jgi:hypothetical protein
VRPRLIKCVRPYSLADDDEDDDDDDRFAMLRFAVDFFAAEPVLRFAAVFVPVLRLALDFAVERLAVVLFLAVARFADDFVADLAVLRPVDFFVAVRDAVLRAPVERLVLERFAVVDLRAPDLAVDVFFVAAIGNSSRTGVECAEAPRWALRGTPAWRAWDAASCEAATRPPRGS